MNRSIVLLSLILVSLHPGTGDTTGVAPETGPDTQENPGSVAMPDPTALRDGQLGDQPQSATVPFSLDHNRMIVEVGLVGPDGTARTARAWVDTGNQFLVLTAPLARALGYELPQLQEHSVEISAPPPRISLGELPLQTTGVGVSVFPGTQLRAAPAELNLPAGILRHYHVVFDYPAQRLTVARTGVLTPQGEAVPCRVNADTGLPMLTAMLDGEPVQLGIDNGSSGTWVSIRLTAAWQERHTDWPRATGAAGSANFWGFPFETTGVLMRLPELQVGKLRLDDVAVLGLDPSIFDWYSQKSAGPVLGFLGANVLRRVRLEIDFPNQTSYWQAGPPAGTDDLDIVGLALRREPDGSFTVAGVVSRDGSPVVEGVEPGDALLRIDDLETTGASFGTVVQALRGTPGTKHSLQLERVGERFTVTAEVQRLP